MQSIHMQSTWSRWERIRFLSRLIQTIMSPEISGAALWFVEVTAELMQLAKTNNIKHLYRIMTAWLVRRWSMVDTVLTWRGASPYLSYLEGSQNRFGSTNEIKFWDAVGGFALRSQSESSFPRERLMGYWLVNRCDHEGDPSDFLWRTRLCNTNHV